jgi:uncharacterized membrane protein
VRITFDVPADPAYAGRVATVLSGLYLRKYVYIGAALVVIGLVGVAIPLLRGSAGSRAVPVFTAMLVVGALSLLFPAWVRFSTRRRSSGLAVDGGYDITDENIMMRSGTESDGIAWAGVTRVTETPAFWIVYVGKIPSTVIPREFMSAEEEQTLRAFMVDRGALA